MKCRLRLLHDLGDYDSISQFTSRQWPRNWKCRKYGRRDFVLNLDGSLKKTAGFDNLVYVDTITKEFHG